MMSLSITNLLLIFGIVCLMIAIIGQAKLFFGEINPGFFGRLLALIIAIFSLTLAATFMLFPAETPDLVRSYLTKYISQFIGMIFHYEVMS
ncbi:MAG: hypothetical protein KME60_22020 [Cyanomargarita calcarea GSE-NOS-MK-12-04C]|jgi:hypothetical protein|uniref:Uncharacterized protein n=1 Tax=Cyanomargarita calcarea GSE-NOS-MK-12-04C TaxID=2839659 RepID=A0A951QS46_9CYAN|nr:hypothetical protein [Cyanomargarita calcarea GSE-NOS-MK-12-04C]